MRWKTGPIFRVGAHRYIHLIRAPGEPDSMRNQDRPVRDGIAQWLKDLKLADRTTWERRVHDSLKKIGKPCTFHRLGLEMLGRSADVLFESPIDDALWSLVEKGVVDHTIRVPILFRVHADY
jgi:hypothetical protein